MEKIKINDTEIGPNSTPYIAAEAGINHNGEIEKAFKMIDLASKKGANAVKFQTFKASEFISDSRQQYSYFSQGKEITESMLEMFQRCEFTREEWVKIKKKCDDEKIQFLSTPQNYSDLELLLELDVPAIKIGSDDFTNLPLLEKYSSTKLPLILSCGMATEEEVRESLSIVGTFDGYPTILLLTTSQYPTPSKDVNLLKLNTLKEKFPEPILGFSDHTQGPLASSLAVVFGACFFEKHFTLDHSLAGPDHWFSEDPKGLSVWIDSIKRSHTMLGSSIIKPTKDEEMMKKIARRSVTALKEIKRGEIFDETNTGVKRPGHGLEPKFLGHFFGKASRRHIEEEELLDLGDIENE